MAENTEIGKEAAVSRGMSLFKTGLLVAGSAMLGGLAVVLWNRNTLARLRQPHEAAPAEEAEEV